MVTSAVLSPIRAAASAASFFLLPAPPTPTSTLFPYTTLFRSMLFFGLDAASKIAFGFLLGFFPVTLAVLAGIRSEEHTSELQSHSDLVCRLLLEKKNGRSVPWRRRR